MERYKVEGESKLDFGVAGGQLLGIPDSDQLRGG